MRSFDLIVIGAGAAGVMAAGVAARRGWRVLLCEKMEKPQRKVRITGKGRCNLTNMRSTTEFLEKVRSSREFFAPALQYFSNRDTVAFFEQIGLPLNTERGERVFPSSGRAWDVATQHIRWCESQGVTIECHTRAVDLLTQNRQITSVLLETPQGREEVQSPRVLLATGGASYPATGSTGDGYGLAHRLGHHIVAIRPSLTPLESSLHGTAQLKGLNLRNITARLLLNGTSVQEEFGEMEFTPWISGAIILRLSRRAVDALIDGDRVEITLDLKPALSEAQIRARLERECSLLPPAAPVTSLLRKMVPGPLVSPLLRQGGIPERTPCKMLTASVYQLLIQSLKVFRLPICDYRPFEEAIVTAGGVDTSEVDPQTMESLKVKGLYFAGELLDLDADTGGYNLQIAYSTGYMAGSKMQ